MAHLPDRETVARAPKVILHDHLDGGLRPATILELAGKEGIAIPAQDTGTLRSWFARGAARGSLGLYLEGFAVTTSVMRTAEALERVAYEALEDLHRDGVVYAELRFAPQHHEHAGLPAEKVMEAVLRGMRRAEAELGIAWGLIVCGMRSSPPEASLRMAELAVAFREQGCVGFDLAGDESGYPPKNHLEAFHLCHRENFNITIHAGEGFGVPSIWQALQYCGTHRVGHGTRLVEDMVMEGGRILRLGTLAQYVLDHRIPLELCLSSNVHTGTVPEPAAHPFGALFRCGFRVTLSCDNRLMSGVGATEEHLLAIRTFGLTLADLERLVLNGMKSAFAPFKRRCDLIHGIILPAFEALRSAGDGAL